MDNPTIHIGGTIRESDGRFGYREVSINLSGIPGHSSPDQIRMMLETANVGQSMLMDVLRGQIKGAPVQPTAAAKVAPRSGAPDLFEEHGIKRETFVEDGKPAAPVVVSKPTTIPSLSALKRSRSDSDVPSSDDGAAAPPSTSGMTPAQLKAIQTYLSGLVKDNPNVNRHGLATAILRKGDPMRKVVKSINDLSYMEAHRLLDFSANADSDSVKDVIGEAFFVNE